MWETYSSFSNTHGGIILLGVAEREDKSLYSIGLTEVEVLNLQKIFWDIINNPKKVSSNLLSDKNVKVEQVDSSYILVIEIPEATRYEKPIYINDNPLLAYRRNFEGDYKVTRLELSNMLRDADINSPDSYIVENMGLDVFNQETIEGYKNLFIANKGEEHVFSKEPLEKFLFHIGAINYDENNVPHPTKAGLLMFGYDYHIVRVYPNYFLDYQDHRHKIGDMRWSNRICSSVGDWSGNLLDFYWRIANKLVEDLPIPFKLEGFFRVDNTPMHDAMREALCNTLCNADFNNSRGLVVKQYEDNIYFTNPGALAMPLNKALKGGTSDARNKTILAMFNNIKIGERGGTGIPKIWTATKDAEYPTPILIDSFNPDITELTVFIKKDKTNTITSTKSVDLNLTEQEQIIVDYIKQYGFIRRSTVEDILGIKQRRANTIINDLISKNIIIRNGINKNMKYHLK
ncbi:MAG: hypothetical protein NC087_06455 [Anaeroplasma bactoclasticum]|nr:hypothetical protein [Anaeroplasma bactoclasticum]